jgi:hypothetical protein
VSAVLETETDRSVEVYTVQRLLTLYPEGTQFIKMPPFSFCDYVVTLDGEVIEFVEIKTRKEPHFAVRGYGGLILKCRKADEMALLAKASNTPTHVIFAFFNGKGAIYQVDVSTLANLTPVTPPRRRNFRNLSCDDEPVYMLDWWRDIERILPPLSA